MSFGDSLAKFRAAMATGNVSYVTIAPCHGPSYSASSRAVADTYVDPVLQNRDIRGFEVAGGDYRA